ncbi:MAG: transcriptional regulator [Rhodoferax sp.]|nr:transcriptional regulator [Rhodoferax sp.]
MARKLPSFDKSLSVKAATLADLGKIVRNQRAHLGLRIDDTAGFSAVGASVLSRLENGKPITTDKLLAILDSLGLLIAVLPKRKFIEVQPMLEADTDTQATA